jgi:YesN/AraC family two-component response regulator
MYKNHNIEVQAYILKPFLSKELKTILQKLKKAFSKVSKKVFVKRKKVKLL